MSLLECRINAGKKVLEVSYALGVSPSAIYKWERGETRPTAENLVKLKEFYKCTADDLLRKDGLEHG